jgi:ATP-binding cassette subfamily F protein 3
MDEPTTHLDIGSIDAMVNALKGYTGTLIFISHDVHFIRSLAETVLHVHSGRLTSYAGNYDYYLEKSKATNARAALTAGFTDARPEAHKGAAKKAEPAPTPATTPSSGGPKLTPNQLRKMREEVGQLEKKVAELETKQNEITAALEDPATYAEKSRFHRLNIELSTITEQVSDATSKWEAATEALDAAERHAG